MADDLNFLNSIAYSYCAAVQQQRKVVNETRLSKSI